MKPRRAWYIGYIVMHGWEKVAGKLPSHYNISDRPQPQGYYCFYIKRICQYLTHKTVAKILCICKCPLLNNNIIFNTPRHKWVELVPGTNRQKPTPPRHTVLNIQPNYNSR